MGQFEAEWEAAKLQMITSCPFEAVDELLPQVKEFKYLCLSHEWGSKGEGDWQAYRSTICSDADVCSVV